MSSGNSSPLPKTMRGSFASIDSDYRRPKVSERKPSPNSRSSKEKPVAMRVSEMQQSQLWEELKRAKEELSELKTKKTEGSVVSNGRIKMLEAEAEKAKDSEMKMLESLFSQTKQLEQTKILFEEAKLEIRNLQDRNWDMENSAAFTSRRFENQEELRKLRNELRLALEVEEKGKKAMDDLAIVLAEMTTEATHAKAGLAVIKPMLEKSRAEAALANASLKSTKQNLQETLQAYDKLKLEYEESAVAWEAKEDGYKNRIKISEEEMQKKDQENSKLSEVLKMANEENFKLKLEYEESAVAWKAKEDGYKNRIKISEEEMQKKDQENSKLSEVLKMANEQNFKLKLEYEESAVAWKAKEDGYKNRIKISEEDMQKKDQENSKLTEVLKMASQENFQLRDIIKQAVNEATVVKESLEIVQCENDELNEQLSKKENDLQQRRLDYESLKVSEASALQSVRELKSLLASDSANNSNKASNLAKLRSFRASNVTVDDSMITKSTKNRHSSRWPNEKPRVHSGRWSSENPRVQNCHGHRFDVFNCLALDKDGSFEIKDKKLGSVSVVPETRPPSSVFVDDRRLNRDDVAPIDVVMLHNAEIAKQKKKKTFFERFSDSLRRRSFLKP